MKQRKCRKCKRDLPEGYKHAECERCRNNGLTKIIDVGKVFGGLALGYALSVVTKGKIKLPPKV